MRQPALSWADEPIRGAGALVLYSIDDASELLVVAVRHQCEGAAS